MTALVRHLNKFRKFGVVWQKMLELNLEMFGLTDC